MVAPPRNQNRLRSSRIPTTPHEFAVCFRMGGLAQLLDRFSWLSCNYNFWVKFYSFLLFA